MGWRVGRGQRALTLFDRLSRLSFVEACRLLGPQGEELLRVGARHAVKLPGALAADAVQVTAEVAGARGRAAVWLWLGSVDGRLRVRCAWCARACEHAGALLSEILEHKVALGLARPPDEGAVAADLVAQALEERAERARREEMTVRAREGAGPWADYVVTSRESGRSYRVALRGEARGDSFCSCPDFRKNTLGTCKHILHVLAQVWRRFGAAERRRARPRSVTTVYLRYGEELELRVAPADELPALARVALAPIVGRAVADVADLTRRLARLAELGVPVTMYPDAAEHVERRRFAERVRPTVAEIRADPARHPLRTGLLRATLLPYQLDGVAFAVGAGRAVLADDMGLGKTIQAIGVAELLAREAGIGKVLVVCPASVKAQWRAEVERFSHRSCQIVEGSAAARAARYVDGTFFSICNYEQVLRDLRVIEAAPWDLIVLDEGQRIKNWEARTSAVVKRLRSQFALVLTGTPLENRLDELYSVIEFVDDRRLGPAFRFFERHHLTTDDGRVVGYQRLDELRARLAPVLLRRTRAAVAQELPPRSTELVRLVPTAQQVEVHHANLRIVAQILGKDYLSEMDLLRLRKALLMCRMAADSTFLVDKQGPGYSSKLAELERLLPALVAEGHKLVVFSEWTTMLDRIEPILAVRGLRWVRLDGSVPQAQRQRLVDAFQRDPTCRLFLTSNAGSVGLNLQAADTVVNVDLPWNPAVLEQRIGRVHRMGQTRPVRAYVLVTEGTIEENLLGTLAAKHALALAALDADSQVTTLGLGGGLHGLKRRLEVLLGARSDAPIDERGRAAIEAEALARTPTEPEIVVEQRAGDVARVRLAPPERGLDDPLRLQSTEAARATWARGATPWVTRADGQTGAPGSSSW